jgi:thiol-disulfide isomerase/thioredoxin
LFQNFFAKGDTVLLNEASKKSITERAYSMMANQLGLAAPSLIVNTPDNKKVSLYDQKAPYTFLAFWDPTCSHCKVEIPRLDSFYKASWKNLQVKIFSVNTNTKELAAWKTFIQENHLENWTHAYQTEEDLYETLIKGNFDIRFLGDDYIGKPFTGDDLDIPIQYLNRDHGWSTTMYKQLIADSLNKK